VDRVIALSNGGVDFSFEAVGSAATSQEAFGMLAEGGLCTIVGVVMGEDIILSGSALQSERRIQGSRMGSNRFRVDIPHWLDFYATGKLLLDDLVTAHYTPDELGEAIGSLARGEGVRGVMMFDV
ncbi:MAG: zinc-binding dehydrogenase, partial [Acidimicrobiales bacterium]